jgi:nitrite reductase (NO-forming)
MQSFFRQVLRDWFIVIAAAVIAGGVLALSLAWNALSPGQTHVAAQSEQPQGPRANPQDAAEPPAEPSTTAAVSADPPASEAEAAPAQNESPAALPENESPAALQESDENSGPPDMEGHTMAAATPAVGGGDETGAAGDPVAGRQVFAKCQACHSMEPGRNMLGPSLAGVVGRKAGAEPDYSYSEAMERSGLTWDIPTLQAYLAAPQEVIPGNKMPFPGLKTEHDLVDIVAFLAAAGGTAGSDQAAAAEPPGGEEVAEEEEVAQAEAQQVEPNQAPQSAPAGDVAYIPDARYTLRSGIAEGRMVYIGVGGAIDGLVNPILTAAEGQVVQVTLINGEGAQHDVVFPDQDAKSPRITGQGSSTTIAFRAAAVGDFVYYCSVPGHREAGMEGQFIVTPRPPDRTVVEADISRAPDDLPPPLERREPQTVHVELVSVELEGRLAEGTTFGYWTFNGKVPGPFIRVRVGDTIDLRFKNAADSGMIHSVDFHAATGPGGGAASTQVDPGEEKSLRWKALVPGLYVYHCATPMVAMHVANGMYGLILVEPEEGLPPVDREFYLMQGEIYTDTPFGQRGSHQFSVEKLLAERPEYFVFNGSVGALSRLHPLRANVGETVRIFFGVGGPNFTSSFHVIGEIFDKVYTMGGVLTTPLEGIQTATVPAGGSVITEFMLDVPGNYTIVDHALARTEKGLVGILTAEGQPNPEIYDGEVMPGMGH